MLEIAVKPDLQGCKFFHTAYGHGMANERIAQLISKGLREGMMWPGDPENNIPPKMLQIPAFAAVAGVPEEMTRLIRSTADMIGEAFVAIVEAEGIELTSAERMDVVRTNEQREDGVWAGRPLPVHCRCDKDFTDPLMFLTVRGSQRIVVDGRALLRGLQHRAVQHPHKRIEPTE